MTRSRRVPMTQLLAALLFTLVAASPFDMLLDVFSKASDFLGFPSSDFEKANEAEEVVFKKQSTSLFKTNISVVDFSTPGLPKGRHGHRVADLFSGWMFDEILQDAPDSVRPGSVVVFYNSSDKECMQKYQSIGFDSMAEYQLPARSQLFTARYDMYSAPLRPWYEFTPEMDLQKRFKIDSCPSIVHVSRKCNGWTEWCERGKDEEMPEVDVFGCEDFKEQCVEELRTSYPKDLVNAPKFDRPALVKWINERIETDGRPLISRFLGSYEEQGRWLQKREHTTCNTHFRNIYLADAFPAFAHRGFKAMKIPDEVQEWLLDFVKTHERHRKTENWNAESTQMSFHEKPTTFIDMDRVRAKKNQMANKYLKPIVEEWAGISPLELTSFYGMREYHEDSWLRQHVDRIDTHVLSITLSVAKRNFTFDKDGTYPYKPWPLRVLDWTGRNVAYDHPPGTMILYESAKLPHGRPTRNEGGIHLGCFVHFKPATVDAATTKHWDDVAAYARKNQNMHTVRAKYISTPEIEPEVPEYCDNVGDGSIWTKKGEKASENSDIGVQFVNLADRVLDVYWYTNLKSPQFQGQVGPGARFSVNSYHGHTFFWAEPGQQTPLQGGKFTVDVGKREYVYKLKRDGSVHKV